MKTGKSSKIDRITHILEGRKDTKFDHDGHAGGLTNKEKLRKKNFIMVRKGKKSVNNKSRKAAGLDRHEKNTAVGLQIYLFLRDPSQQLFTHYMVPLYDYFNSNCYLLIFFFASQKEQFGRDKRKRRRT